MMPQQTRLLSPEARRRKRLASLGRSLMWAGLLVGAALLVYRGVLRNDAGSGDLAVVYGSARTWLYGQNPYDYPTVAKVLAEAGFAGMMPHPRDLPVVYPPATLVALAPLAALPWRVAWLLWLAGNLLWLGWIYRRLIVVGRLDDSWAWSAGFLLALLWFAPIHTALAKGQLSIAAVGLACTCLWREDWPRTRRNGLAAGLATVCKPHVGGVSVGFLLLRGRWRALGVSLAVIAAVTAVGVLQLQAHGIDALAAWSQNLTAFHTGGAGDATATGPLRHQLLNLHHPLHVVIGDRNVVQVAVLLLLGSAGLAGWRWSGALSQAEAGLALMALLAPLALLGTVHRYYDAVLLVFPLAWALRRLRRGGEGCISAWVVLACCAVLAAPGAGILHALSEAHRLPADLTQRFWWNFLVLPHQVWALCVMVLAVLGGLRPSQRAPVEERPAIDR